MSRAEQRGHGLYLIEILHQTTTVVWIDFGNECCILSKFYIKPQRWRRSTSFREGCILSKFYIKPQRFGFSSGTCASCILSKFYIKPQPGRPRGRTPSVVSYRNSTSNHNWAPSNTHLLTLYLIEILHQTTTLGLIWTTTKSCILSKFYIKPQLPQKRRKRNGVVSYRNSTSNHNRPCDKTAGGVVVSYRNSTSNHNQRRWQSTPIPVVSYRNSTSNHNR